MDNDNDFTFCKVDLPSDQESLEGQIVENMSGISITTDNNYTNQADTLLWKGKSLEKTSLSKQAVAPPDKVRAKVPFEKGYSQMDWLKLTRTHPDLAGLKGASTKRLISIDEVKQHKTEDSIWTVLKGRVYNITPYMKFHPGDLELYTSASAATVVQGCLNPVSICVSTTLLVSETSKTSHAGKEHCVDMLMKAAGKDCTLLFNKYHAWVNDEFLLEKCLVGTLDGSR
ncbi:hypothetical protein IFM89_029862 [Coptis chinensis]|uniref:Cytochrome b5 heme-binding domain-containing protein n=1 Tax=Coptis chinensis TaxID=261450 RepID=A0A835HSS8_9MAGN|nr:hypothetical protein IFM89_029862 [Coptis chinensis]